MLKYIISPVLGAAVGYFTNWLAIKMLFKPYEEKRIMGIKIPFTPGLIFKQRYKISQKIGRVSEDYILTNYVMGKYISLPQNKKSLYNHIDSFLKKIEEKDYTVEKVTKLYLKKNYENFFKNTELNIQKAFVFLLNNEVLAANADKAAKIFIDEALSNIKIDKYIDILFKSTDNIDTAYDLKDKLLVDGILDKSFEDIFGENAIDKIKNGIKNTVPKFCDKLAYFINNEHVDDKLNKLAKKIIEENVRGFAGLFVNSNKIYLNIKSKFLDFINSEDGKKLIEDKILSFVCENYNLSFKNILFKVDINDFLYKNLYNFSQYLREKSSGMSFNDALKVFCPDFKDKILNKAGSNFKAYLEKRVEIFSHNITEYIKNMKINGILSFLRKIILNEENYEWLWENIAEKGFAEIVKHIKISSVIEERINEFDMKLIEEITLSIVKKELNAITLFGGVLGFIIGLIPIAAELFGRYI